MKSLPPKDRGVGRSGSGTRGCEAFSVVELLVGLVIAALVIGAAAVALGTLSKLSGQTKAWGTVTLASGVLENFYGVAATTVEAPFAPNYGRGLPAPGSSGRTLPSVLRDALESDIRSASAVFCLGRSGLNTYSRANAIAVTNFDGRVNGETVQAFNAAIGGLSIFQTDRNVMAGPSSTIFILEPSGVTDGTGLRVRAIYDADVVAGSTGGQAGVYASVRRYESGVLTMYYDVFYPGASTGWFGPTVVAFERRARLSTSEGSAIDRFKVAENRPFCFVWWPDPASATFASVVTASYASSDPRQAYASMAGRTSLFFVIPLFPAL